MLLTLTLETKKKNISIKVCCVCHCQFVMFLASLEHDFIGKYTNIRRLTGGEKTPRFLTQIERVAN